MKNNTTDLSHLPTLVHILKERARMTPDKVAYIYLEDGEDKELPITYAELDQRARRLAAKLQEKNANSHDSRVLLIYPQGLEFLIAFFGSLYAGATAVLVFPPTNKKMAKRLNGIVEDCDVSLVLSTGQVLEKMHRLESVPDAENPTNEKIGMSRLEWINTDDVEVGMEANFKEIDITPDHIAFLQYTSGSTGTPKGVMISHGNLMANEKTIKSIFATENPVYVGWLPLIHDMGLIGKALQPMYLGVPLIFMSPLHFMQKPVRWLRAISKYRGTSSGAPNFAYDLCANKIGEDEMEGLDLSSWRNAFNGAEPVRRETVDRFLRKFATCGLNPDAYMAVYGLAEATLIVSGTRRGHPLLADEKTGYMPSGMSEPWDTVAVVDVETLEEVAEGTEGEIWVNGPSVAKGYWNRLEETRDTFQARLKNDSVDFMRTGDTGFFREGQLHITGRIKDIIIIQGKNYHAEDIEWSANDVPGLRPGCIAAFQVEEDHHEKLVVVAGALSSDEAGMPNIVSQIRAAIYADHHLHVDRVVLIKPKELPMTTSGKVQRRLSRQMYLKGKFTVLFDLALHQHGAVAEDAKVKVVQFVEPGTPAERELAHMWHEILNVPVSRIGVHNNFFELGGNSLTMLELATRLGVTMELLFRYPTIAGYLYRNSEYEFPAVEEDIYLPPMHLNPNLTGRTNISLITGGTGFFGLHFLQSMMQRTDDTFVLLVRGKTQEAIEKKFDAAVAYFHMENSIERDRVVLVQGDLSKKNVGIPYSKYAWVADNVDRIFHIGSHVNNWLPYEGIKEINTDGTRSLLQLARTGRKKEFHYTSTSTFSPDKEDQAIFHEGDRIDRKEINRYFGYDISKYASEEMCRLARQDGIICNIYRLVWVGGHFDTGLTKTNDGLNIMLRILLTLGAFPQGNYLHDIVPVDLMADAMASIQGKGCENMNFNVTSQSKESIDMKRIAVMLRSMGYKLEEVSRAEFVHRLASYPMEKWDEHCKSYRQLIIRLFEDPTPKVESFYDSINFRTYMDPAVLSKMEQKFIDRWFEQTVNFLVRNNALPTPSSFTYKEDLARIGEWNKTNVPFPASECLHQLFEEQAQKTPNSAAIVYEGQQTTYAELNRKANVIAHHLVAKGVKSQQFVGLSVNRSADLIAAILGIFKAGAAYLPLDPTYPVASLDFMISDCGAELILVDSTSKTQLAHHASKLIEVDTAQFALTAENANVSANSPNVEHNSSDLAYIIYTSGTTGKPKGVLVEHKSVVNHNFSIMKTFGMTSSDKLLQFSTVNFDSFIEEVFPTLFSGATLVMTRKDQLTDVDRLTSVITRNSVSVLKFSTAFWHAISELNVQDLGVRLVAIGGEAADLNRYNAWREKNPSIPLVNTYGPTETTVTCTLSVLHGPLTEMHIGRPINNTQVHVLDAHMNQVPLGFIGELYIAGCGVTRGYLNRPENNAAAFFDSPFVAGEKLYKSGDLVRWRQDGNIEFLGRSDNQVKVRGYRIELGAIESVLGTHPAVDKVAVVVKEVDTRKKIVAYFTTKNEELQAAELRAFVENLLPSYMIPNLMLQLPAIPLNPNGKIDRKLLEDMEISVAGNADFATPSTPNEIKMAKIWENLLHVTNIGLNDEFMDLGGHSLLVMSLVSEVNTAFGSNISIHSIFEYPTVGKLLASIENAQGSPVTPNLIRFPEMPAKKQELEQVRPLFLVHGLGGHLASFYPLVKNLKKVLHDKHNMDITVYGLEANGFKEGEEHFESLDSMVREYVDRIMQTQASGPYLIGGWSYGVAVAFHIVQELKQRGQEVGLFISIDAEAPYMPADFAEFIQGNNVESLDDLYEDETLKTLLGKFGKRFGFFANDHEDPKQQFYRFLGYSEKDSIEEVERYSKVAISNLFNARGFNPDRVTPVNTVLVRATLSNFDNYMGDWAGLIDSKMLSSLTLNGDHWSIMQDPELAAQLARLVANSPEALEA